MLFQLTVATRQATDGIHVLALYVSAHHELQQQADLEQFSKLFIYIFTLVESALD